MTRKKKASTKFGDYTVDLPQKITGSERGKHT
jgi:hypothetical protein